MKEDISHEHLVEIQRRVRSYDRWLRSLVGSSGSRRGCLGRSILNPKPIDLNIQTR